MKKGLQWPLIALGCALIGVAALKLFGPEDTQAHFEKTRGPVDIEKLKKQAAEYEQKRKDFAAGKVASEKADDKKAEPAPAPAKVDVTVASATFGDEASPKKPAASPPPAATASASAAKPEEQPSTESKRVAQATRSEVEKFGTSWYIRYPDRVLRLRVNTKLSASDQTLLEHALAGACLRNENTPETDLSVNTDESKCSAMVSVKATQDESTLRLSCDDDKDECLSDLPVHLKIASSGAQLSLASDIALYSPSAKKQGAAKHKTKIYRTNSE